MKKLTPTLVLLTTASTLLTSCTTTQAPVKVTAQKTQATEATQLTESLNSKAHLNERMSMDFDNVKVDTALSIIAEFSGNNMVVSDDVSGELTIKTTNKPWKQTLQSILDSKNLALVTNGNVIYIDTKEAITRAKVQEYAKKKYVEESISLDFSDIPIKDGLTMLAEASGKNIVISDDITGNIRLFLQNVPYDQAFDLILLQKRLKAKMVDNVMVITPMDGVK